MTVLKPNSAAQSTFLASPADIAVYGGSAGGGKSWALLLEALRHTSNPAFGAVLFRKTSPQITNEGGLWDEAGAIYPLIGGAPRIGDLEYVFANGSRVAFRHLQHEKNKYDWQGSQVPMMGFDELPHFSESQFFYMLSRNRSTCGVRPYVRATTNPDAGSWVKRFLAPWVDRKFPDRAVSGEVRHFVRIDGKLVWHRDGKTLESLYPNTFAKSVTFVRASLFDNVDLMRKDPGYLANLQAQTPVERARLLDGDWDAVNEGLVYPDFGSCVIEAEDWPAKIEGTRHGGVDWGFNNPFAALGAILDRDDVLWVEWERYAARTTLTDHSEGMSGYQSKGSVRWWGDPAGADQIAEMRRAGHDIRAATHHGQRPLEAGIALVTQRMRSGRLKIRGTLGSLIEESTKYRYDKQTEKPVDEDNHALAALRYMINSIDRGRSVEPVSANQLVSVEAAREAAEAAAIAEAREMWNTLDNEAMWQ